MKYIFTLSLLCLSLFTGSAQEVFQKALGSTGSDYLTDVQRLSSGNYIALGYSRPTGADSTYAQLFKLDADFNLLWSKTFTFNNHVQLQELRIGTNNSYFLIGRTWQTPTAATKQGAIAVKTDTSGNLVWTRILKYDGSETMTGIGEEADGSLRFFVSAPTTCYFQKADAAGVPTGAPTSITNGTYDLSPRRVVRMGAERYAIMGGITNGGDHIAMLNKDTLQWVREFTGIANLPRLLNAVPDAAGNLFFVGDYQAGPYVQRSHFVGKVNSDGTGRWVTVLPMLYVGARGPDTVWRYATGRHIQLQGTKVLTAGYLQNEQKGYSYGMISMFDSANTTGNNWNWSRVHGNRTGLADSFARVIPLPNGQFIGAGNTGLGGNTAAPNFYFVKTDTLGISPCNSSSYAPVEPASSAAFLGINRFLQVGVAPALNPLTSYSDAVVPSTKAPLSNTTTICTAQLCPPNTITSSATPATACIGDTVTLRASGGTNYSWSGAALGQPSADSTVRVRMAGAGIFSFNVAVQPRGNTCFSATTLRVTVNPNPTGLPIDTIFGTGALRYNICIGDSLTIPSGAVGSSTLTWGSPTNSPWRQGLAQTNIIVKPILPGLHLYSCSIRSNLGCTVTGNARVTVRPNVVPTVTLEPLGCPGPDLTLRAKGTPEGASATFDWLIDGVLIGGRRELRLENAIGKKVQIIMNVGADVCPTPPTTRQVRSDLITVSCQGTGTKDVELARNIVVFPNPTEGAFTVKIQLDQPRKVSFAVRNVLGQAVQTTAVQKLDAGEFTQQFNLNQVAAGLYFVETRLDDKVFLTKVLVQ